MGRPPVPTHLKRNRRMVVMLTETEADKLSAAATREGAASVSDWVRDILIGAADSQAGLAEH